jgi:pimeloyl-ACP methyl ester carboxylesterase
MKTDYVLGLGARGFHKIAVHIWGQEGSSVPPVICVHGLTRNGRDFDKLAARLSRTRPVYCPDMVGRGLSDRLSDAQEYSFEQYKTDALALIARTGARQVDWIGTSMGGILGMLLAALPGTPIRRLVLNDVGPFVAKETVDRLGAYLLAPPPVFDTVDEVEAFMRGSFQGYGVLQDDDWQAMAEYGSRRRDDGRFELSYDPEIAAPFRAETADVDLRAVYAQIDCPTLLVRGEKSELLPKALAEEMTRTGPCAKLVEIEGAAHAPSLMTEPQIMLVEEFLKG